MKRQRRSDGAMERQRDRRQIKHPDRPAAHIPLKPRPRLLMILSIIFALWVVALIVMYITTPRH